jgi:hypothetical protein
MSEVKRWVWVFDGMSETPKCSGSYVEAKDYDAALAREAALREELAESGKADHLRARIAFLTKEIHAMSDRLTAAEQRNAETSAALQLATRLLASGLSALNPRAGLAKNVRAFLDSQRKPTESGASE